MIHSIVQQVKAHLKRIANKEIAIHSQKFFKTGNGEYAERDLFVGIRVPVLRKLVKQYRDISLPDVSQLLKSKYHEERLLSLLMLVTMFGKADEENRKSIYDLYLRNTKFINNWDLVDSSAGQIVGAYLKNRDKTTLYALAHSQDLWERRISIISTFHYIKNNDFHDALTISEILLQDTQDLIHKAVGWMLREIGKRDMNVLEEFLKKHYTEMPRTMLRYAIEKFPEGKRQRYLKRIV